MRVKTLFKKPALNYYSRDTTNLTQSEFLSDLLQHLPTSKIFRMAPVGTLWTVDYQSAAKYVRYLTLSPWILKLILFSLIA